MTVVNFEIIRGIQKPPGQTNSAEQDFVSFSLIGYLEGKYSPRHSQTKGGGIWADSALSDGRYPLALQYGTIVETVNLRIAKPTMEDVNAEMAFLGRLELACKRFLTTHTQIEPVYLKYKHNANTPEQFALIFDLNIEATYDDNDPESEGNPTALVTLSWEREIGWRAVAPGYSPVKFARDLAGELPGADYDYEDLISVVRTNSLKGAIISNRVSYEFGGGNQDVNTFTADSLTWDATNDITIEKELLPGDIPALVSISEQQGPGAGVSVNAVKRIFVGQSITQRDFTNNAGDTKVYHDRYMQNAGDASNETTGSFTASWQTGTGVISNGQNVTKYFVRLTIPTGAQADSPLLSWGPGGGSAGTLAYGLRVNAWRGKYAVFLRANLNSGTSSHAQLYCRFRTNSGTFGYVTETALRVSPLAKTTAVSNSWKLHYLGSVSLPPGDRTQMTVTNATTFGLLNSGGLYIDLRCAAKASGTGVVVIDVCDLILIPYDIGMIEIDTQWNTTTGLSSQMFVVDETSFLSHGTPFMVGQSRTTGQESPMIIEGLMPQFIPKIDNRLHFLFTEFDTSTGEEYSNPDSVFPLSINAVPRWQGIRDE